ncbi:MAG: universal stress protein [Pseudomonadota bacterium]
MSIKTIAVSLVDIERQDAVMNAAFSLAGLHDAHVLGVYPVPSPHGIAIPASFGAISADIDNSRFFEDHLEDVKTRFEDAVRRHAVRAEWRRVDGETGLLADAMLKHVPYADLIVAGQVNSSTSNTIEPDFVERLILESGRPVLVMPNMGEFKTIGTNVIVGWNATREAMRAAFDAVPVMKGAKRVELLWANARDEPEVAGDLPGSELAAVLSRHDLKVFARSISAPNLSPADALLNEAADNGADLIVIGAYGHSRLREFVFGGVTRTLLQNMTAPVLMSH